MSEQPTNPTTANPLTDVIPAKARKYVYAVIALASLVFGVWQASDGDWKAFVGGLIVALVNATAASNTPARILGKA